MSDFLIVVCYGIEVDTIWNGREVDFGQIGRDIAPFRGNFRPLC